MQTPPDLANGAVFGRQYRVLSRLAEGGMGVVYLVEQVSTHKQRALKVMQPALVKDPKHRERFLQEAWVASQIESDHVVEVVDAGVDDESGVPFIAMELLRGQTLAERVDTEGALSHEMAREVIRQVRHPLEQAHRLGLVHRDLKPENVYLASARRSDVPFTTKLLDFGISKWVQEARTAAANSQVIGSPFWMAPEQLEHGARIAPATDVWALGLIAFYMLTGKLYWRTANSETASISAFIFELVAEALVPASQRAAELGVAAFLPEGFDEWFARALVRKSEGRFLNAGEALLALEALFGPPPAAMPRSADTTGGFRAVSVLPPTRGAAVDSTPPEAPPAMTAPPVPAFAPKGTSPIPLSVPPGGRHATPPPPAPVGIPQPIAAKPAPAPAQHTVGPELSLSETSYTFARESQVDRIMGTGTRRTLFEAAVARNDTETARIAAQAMVLREGEHASQEARDFLAKTPAPALVVPRGHVADSAWTDQLLPTPKAFAPLARLFALVVPVAHQGVAQSPAQSGLLDRERVDPMTSAASVLRAINPLHQQMLHAGTAFDVATMPTLYYRAAQTEALRCVPSEPWSSLVGAWIQQQPPPSAILRAFVAGRHLAYYRPEHYVRVLCATDESLVAFFDGLRSMSRGANPSANPMLSAIHDRFGAGSRGHDKLVEAVALAGDCDVRGYARASDCAAVRAGMLLCADLFTVRDALAISPGVGVLQGANDLIEDVASFSVSDSFTRLRKELVGAR